MSRAQQGAIESTQTKNAADSTTAATKSQANEQSDINNETSQLAKFSADNPYVQGGAFQTAQNQTIAGAADATAGATRAGEQALATRTGLNPQAAVAAGEAAAQSAQRTAVAEQGDATTSRLASGADYNQKAISDANAITGQQASLSSNLTGEAQGQLSTAEQAAQTPSFMDELGQGLISGGDALAGGYGSALCPAEGALYLMADGTEIPVEMLRIDDMICGVDGSPQPIVLIETVIAPVVRVTTEDGESTRVSRSHAFSLPFGGFVVAAKSLDKTVRTKSGCEKITAVNPGGKARVFNVITRGGSNTYRADSIWAVGMSEEEWAAMKESKELATIGV